MTEYFTIESQEGERIDRYLSEELEDKSRSYIQKLIRDGHVLVDGKTVKAGYRLVAGDNIAITLPEIKEPEIPAENIPLDILYEDKDLLVVNKPKQMVVHPAPGHYTGTLVNALMYHCKTDSAHQSLSAQLKEHSIHRIYEAIVHGNIKEEEGTVNAPIGRHPTDRKKMSIHSRNGKNAVTHYQVLKRFGDYTYIRCRLETGRTHQIRVHMASIGHPLLGDQVYGPKKCPFPKLQGQTLHARILGFIHPSTGEYLEIEAPLPQYFVELLDKLMYNS